MILTYIVIPFICMIPIGVYLYFYFLRMLESFGIKRNRLVKGICIVICSLLVAFGINKYSFGRVLITNIAFFAIVMEAINIILKLMKKRKNSFEKVYKSGLIPIICVCAVLMYGYFNMFHIVETDYTIYTDKQLNQDYRIALISDLHFGTTIDIDRLQEICDDISEKNIDIVALAGDIFDESTTENEMENGIEALSSIKNKYGIYYVFGNHDKNRYVAEPIYTSDEMWKKMEDCNIEVLADEVVRINDDFLVIGRDDPDFAEHGKRLSLNKLLEGEELSKFMLVLDHKPTAGIKEVEEFGADLQLSGHTHGGQMWPNGITREIRNPNYIAYGHRTRGESQIIVTSGIAGWGYPIKTGAPAEYVIVDIKNK